MNVIWRISPDVLFSKVDMEVVLMSVDAGYYFTLDTTGSRIWELLSDKPATIDDLADLLTEEYDVDRETCTKDVQSFIEDMASKNLIIPVAE